MKLHQGNRRNPLCDEPRYASSYKIIHMPPNLQFWFDKVGATYEPSLKERRQQQCSFCVLPFGTRGGHVFRLNRAGLQGDVKPNDKKLGKPIDRSKVGELTIASLKIRNLGSRNRGLVDFEALADLVDAADSRCCPGSWPL